MENLELQVKSSVKDEQVEKLVEEKGKVTNEEIESIWNFNSFLEMSFLPNWNFFWINSKTV